MKKKLRLYLMTANNKFQKFYWFELNGNEFYWGNSSPTKIEYSTLKIQTGNTFTIQTREDFKNLNLHLSKNSYHETGQFHIKNMKDGKYSKIDLQKNWIKKNKIQAPYRLLSLISKTISNYPLEEKNMKRKGGKPMLMPIKVNSDNNRLYIEFFLTRPGTHKMPQALIDFGVREQPICYKSLTPELILMAKYTTIKYLEGWHADTEIIFIEDRDNSTNESLRPN